MAAHQLRPGAFHWCHTHRSDIWKLFSHKDRRPVLVVRQFDLFAAVYPCSSSAWGRSDTHFVGNPLGGGDTHLIFGQGLFEVPIGDIEAPGAPWDGWELWRRTHREVLRRDLDAFQWERQARAGAGSPRLSATIGSALTAEACKRLEEMAAAQAAPAPRTQPPQIRRAAPRKDEFLAAIEALDEGADLGKLKGATFDD